MSQSVLVKVGLPSHLAEGARHAKRVRQLLDQRDAAFARVDADFHLRLKALVDEMSHEGSGAVQRDPPQDAASPA